MYSYLLNDRKQPNLLLPFVAEFVCKFQKLEKIMSTTYFVALTCLIAYVVAQSGVDLDKPMLGGGGKRGPGAMLRFGCSQVSKSSELRLVICANIIGRHRTD